MYLIRRLVLEKQKRTKEPDQKSREKERKKNQHKNTKNEEIKLLHGLAHIMLFRASVYSSLRAKNRNFLLDGPVRLGFALRPNSRRATS